MKVVVGVVVAIASVLAAEPAFARDRCTQIDTDIYECAPPPPGADDVAVRSHLNESGSVDFRLGFVSFAPTIGNKLFTGSGSISGGPSVDFAATGKQLGYVRPRTYGGELAIAYLRRYVRIGGFIGFSGLSPDASATSDGSIVVASGGSMTMFHAGIDAALLIPADRVRVGIGGAFGGDFFSLTLPGFDMTTCRGRPCYTTAKATLGFVQPRLSVDVDLMPPDSAFAASVGGFVGMDVTTDRSIAWGLTLSLHEKQTLLAP